MKKFRGSYKDGMFCFPKSEFLDACAEYGDFTVLVCDKEEAISESQFRWYKMTVRKLAEHTGESQDHWERELMTRCGQGIMEIKYIKDPDGTLTVWRPSVRNLTIEEMRAFIDSIIAYGWQNPDLGIQPPDYNNMYRR